MRFITFRKIFVPESFLVVLLAFFLPDSLKGQIWDSESENKVGLPVLVSPPTTTYQVKGIIRPLIWRYQNSDNDTLCAIPLGDIEFVALHDYCVDGKIDVLECTVTMKND